MAFTAYLSMTTDVALTITGIAETCAMAEHTGF
jgi:hypothetical protein